MNKKAEEYRELLQTAEKQIKRCRKLSKVLFVCAICDLIAMIIIPNEMQYKKAFTILCVCFLIFMICKAVIDKAKIELLIKKDSFQRHIFEAELKGNLFNSIEEMTEEEKQRAMESYATRLMSKVLKFQNVWLEQIVFYY